MKKGRRISSRQARLRPAPAQIIVLSSLATTGGRVHRLTATRWTQGI
ncbi:MAG: hypothetical protein M5U29_09460 [Anaerolineae bacterium]|nr:hypothetical protein [Anaerolineae bacterium]